MKTKINTHELYTAETQGTLQDARDEAIRFAQETGIRPTLPTQEELGGPKTVIINFQSELGDIESNPELRQIIQAYNPLTGFTEGPVFS